MRRAGLAFVVAVAMVAVVSRLAGTWNTVAFGYLGLLCFCCTLMVLQHLRPQGWR